MRKIIILVETICCYITRQAAVSFILCMSAWKSGESLPIIATVHNLASPKCHEISKGESEASVANWNLRPFVLVKWWNDYNWKK